SCSIPSLSVGVGSCAIFEHALDGPFTVSATYNGDGSYTMASSPDITENVGLATATPSISNIPIGAIYGGSFPATVSTISDGVRSVTSSTPAVCTVSNLAVSFV